MSSRKNTKCSETSDAEDISSTFATDASTCATQASSADATSVESDMFGKYKSKPSIFAKTNARENQTDEAQDVMPEEKPEMPPPDTESHVGHVFKEKGFLFKFANEWIGIGEGTAIILEDEEKLRFVFLRTGLNTSALNFWINFDTKALAAGKSVKFLAPDIKDGEAPVAVYAIKFEDDLQSSALAEMLLRYNGPAEC